MIAILNLLVTHMLFKIATRMEFVVIFYAKCVACITI